MGERAYLRYLFINYGVNLMNILKLPFKPLIVADSINGVVSVNQFQTPPRLTSFVICLPTCLLAELRTHRLLKWGDSDFSVNANSDRAIPILKKIETLKAFPYQPIVTLANKGMSGIEDVEPATAQVLTQKYDEAREKMIEFAETLAGLGASKQYVNRLLMPFSWSEVIVTGDDKAWKDFFRLRVAKDVEPNFRYIANLMQEAYHASIPKVLGVGDWHISFEDTAPIPKNLPLLDKLYISGSFSARLSFAVDLDETIEKHRDRFNKCFSGGHVSITEHQATPAGHNAGKAYESNCNGWILLRKFIECNEFPNIPARFLKGAA